MTGVSQSKPWTTNFDTVSQMLSAAAGKHPDRTYCKTSDFSLSYTQTAHAIDGVAHSLGPQIRERTVALVLPNSAAFLIAYFGVLAAGAYPALVNYGHPDATVAKLLKGIDVGAVLSDRDIPGLVVTKFDDTNVMQFKNTDEVLESFQATPSTATAATMFSGGTTGLPKQVDHTNEVLIRKIERMEWGWPTNADETWLPVAPFTHIYGFLMGVLNPVLRGGTIIIPSRFQPDLIVDLLCNEDVTIFGGGPPAIYQAIMASEKFARASFPKLRVCPGGGAPFPLDVHRRWTEATGLPITEGYGMTEIAPISVNTQSDGMKPGAAGKAVPDTEIEIVDVQTGNEVLPVGESGEIRVRGPHMMAGYTDNSDETTITIRDGFIYTGDIGLLNDEGFLIISDRKKDVIFVKGFNVFPREIEETLLGHPAVSGACVVGRTDQRAGELPVAYVTTRADVQPTEIADFCTETLADYKLPAEIFVLEAFPMTPAAKVDRTTLRARANETKR